MPPTVKVGDYVGYVPFETARVRVARVEVVHGGEAAGRLDLFVCGLLEEVASFSGAWRRSTHPIEGVMECGILHRDGAAGVLLNEHRRVSYWLTFEELGPPGLRGDRQAGYGLMEVRMGSHDDSAHKEGTQMDALRQARGDDGLVERLRQRSIEMTAQQANQITAGRPGEIAQEEHAGRFLICRLPDDPDCLRISIGQAKTVADLGAYLVLRGDPKEIHHLLAVALEALTESRMVGS